MKLTIRIALIALIAMLFNNMAVYAQDKPKKKVAVYMTGRTYDDTYKKVIGAKLVSAITESGEYAAVERTVDFLEALQAENDYQASGEVRDSQIAKLGQKFGVRYVVVADASELFDEYFIAARLINVETGLVERAFDANGPAESMAQLIALSKKVARGLLNVGLVELSTKPVNYALCAVFENELVFVTPQEWSKFTNQMKSNFDKIGICLINITNNGEVYILGMNDSQGDAFFARSNHAPSNIINQLIYNHKNQLNNSLQSFGGEIIKDDYYWSMDFYRINYRYGNMEGGSANYIYYVRPVFTLQEIKQRK